jgi:hypothetical protein
METLVGTGWISESESSSEEMSNLRERPVGWVWGIWVDLGARQRVDTGREPLTPQKWSYPSPFSSEWRRQVAQQQLSRMTSDRDNKSEDSRYTFFGKVLTRDDSDVRERDLKQSGRVKCRQNIRNYTRIVEGAFDVSERLASNQDD